MNKFIKIVLIVFGTILYMGTLLLAVRLYNFNPPVYAENIDITKLPNYHGTISYSGGSMVEYGFSESGTATLYPNKQCRVGDFCSFTCLSSKCTLNGEKPDAIKKLISVVNNCYFFEGNKKPIWENGQWMDSWDSNKYGCLHPAEFKMEGVVTL